VALLAFFDKERTSLSRVKVDCGHENAMSSAMGGARGWRHDVAAIVTIVAFALVGERAFLFALVSILTFVCRVTVGLDVESQFARASRVTALGYPAREPALATGGASLCATI